MKIKYQIPHQTKSVKIKIINTKKISNLFKIKRPSIKVHKKTCKVKYKDLKISTK